MSSPRPAAPTRRPGNRLRRLAVMGGPSTRPLAGRRWFPLYGLLHHVGRRSGRQYATPVVIRRGSDSLYVPLPFGERTDWYRNAVVAGGVRATWKGRELWLAEPDAIALAGTGQGFNAVMRSLMGRAGIERVVRFTPLERRDEEGRPRRGA